MLKIDKLAYENALIKTRPSIKVGMSILLLMLSIIIDNNYVKLLIISVNFFICIALARLSYLEYLKLYKIPLLFIGLGLVTMILSIGSGKESYLFYFEMLGKNIGISQKGVLNAVDTLFRSFSAISSTYTLILTTPINQLIGFLQDIRAPRIITEQLILIYRFINVFLEELEKMKIAIELKQGYVNKKSWINSISLISSSLFVKIMDSYKDYSLTLELKHFDGNFN